jgi:hypothetical protein
VEILWWGSHRRKAFSDEGIAADGFELVEEGFV